MNSKIFQNVHTSGASCIRVALGVTAAVVVSMAVLSPACIAQTAAAPDAAPAATQQPTLSAAAVVATAAPGTANSISRVASAVDTLHVLVGHSLFLNTKLRLRRIYITDPAVLNSITLSPNQILVTGMTPGVTSLILLDEAGQAQSYVISSDLDVQGLRTAISEAMHDTVDVQGNGDRVTLSGKVATQASADTAVKLAGLYSKDVANSLTVAPEHPKQVRLKVRILEVDRSKLAQFGVNLFNPGGNTSFLASTTTSQFPSTSVLTPGSGSAIGTLTTSNPLNFLLYSSKLNLGLTVQDLESKNVLQILAEPTITTISGQKASFLSGGEFPFPIIQPGVGGTSSVSIMFKPYGVKLEFTPIVNDDGTIRLKVAPEVSALDFSNAVTVSGTTIPALSSRKAETEVELRSNQSFAISGLLDQRTTDLLSKTPGASSIPIIGALFKSKNINHSTTELVVVITPTLVDPLTDGTAEPAEPGMPIPTLNTETFDKSLGKRLNPNPVVPPMNASPAPAINQATPPAVPSSAPVTPPAGAAEDITPAQPAPSVPAAAPVNPPVVYPAATASIPEPAQPQVSAPKAAPAQLSVPAKVTASSVPPPSIFPFAVPQRYVFDNPAAVPAPSTPPAEHVDVPAPTPAMVQIMALSHKEDADAMVAALKRHGYDVSISQDSRDSLLHLEVGPFKNKSDAEAVRHKLMTDGYNATIQ